MPYFNAKRAVYNANGNIVVLPAEEEVAENFAYAGRSESPKQHQKPKLQDAGLKSQDPNNAKDAKIDGKALRRTKAAAHFTGTFISIFSFLFLALNFGSFSQIFLAYFYPSSLAEGRIALEAVSAKYAGQLPMLQNAPRLPAAGPSLLSMAVSPPDNRLIIPKIGKNVPLVELSDAALRRGDWATFEKDVQHALKFGAVHYPGTAVPGQIGNVFVTGHSSYYPWDWGKYKDVFALLPLLEKGDEYSIYYNGVLHLYRITEKFEVSPDDVSVLAQPNDKYASTLMTCVPVGTTLKRLIIRAVEIDVATSQPLPVANGAGGTDSVKWEGKLAI